MSIEKYDVSMDLSNPIHKDLLSFIPPGSTILEFGPAYGRMTRHLRQTLNCQVYIVELAPEACEMAARDAEQSLCGDLEQLCWEDSFSGVDFDYVLFVDVLEHLKDPQKVLHRLKPMLKPKCKLIAVVPNVAYRGVVLSLLHGQFSYSDLGILDDTHLRFFTKDSLVTLLRNGGFEPEFLQGYENALQYSEFKQYEGSVPLPVAQYLSDRTDSDVYQYLAVATLVPTQTDVPDVAVGSTGQVEGAFQTHILFDAGDGFLDENRTSTVLYSGEGKTVTFSLPGNQNVRFVRWYPAVGRHLLCRDVLLRTKQGRAEPHSSSKSDVLNGMDFFMSGDNWYEFDVRGMLLDNGIINIDYSMEADYGVTAMSWIINDLQYQNDTLTDQLHQIQTQLEKSQSEAEDLKKIYEQITRSKSWRLTGQIRHTRDVVKKGYQQLKRPFIHGSSKYKYQKKRSISKQIETKPQDAPCDASISFVVLTLDGGDVLVDLVNMLLTQENIGEKEIIIIDSESTDGSIQKIKQEGVSIHTIRREDFTHSVARNQGVSLTKGDYIVFITQDALPDGPLWARGMVEPLIKNHAVAVSCRQKATDESNLYFKIGVWHHNRFMKMDQCDRVACKPQSNDFVSMRQNAQLDNVACAVKRNVCLAYPYRGHFAEDLDLGIRLLTDDYSLAFLSSRYVWHTHRHSPAQTLKRSFMGNSAFREIFPMPPAQPLTQPTLLSLAIVGYKQVSTLCRAICEMNIDSPSAEDLKTRLDSMIESLDSYYADKKVFLDVDDPFFQIELADLYALYLKLPYTVDIDMRRQLAMFCNQSLYPYILSEQPQLNTESGREIADCFFQYYAAFLGERLADYYSIHPSEDPVCQMAERLGTRYNDDSQKGQVKS